MKVTTKAGDLAEALALAELALAGLSSEMAKRIAALSAVHVRAADGVLALTANVLDFCITVKTRAEILEPVRLPFRLTRCWGWSPASAKTWPSPSIPTS
jgi:hypothetical protein